jgi:hypothetical protein
MKNLLITAVLVLSSYAGFSQTDSVVVDTTAKDTVVRIHSLESLTPLTKVALTTIYLNQVANLSDLLGKTALREGDVPTNRYINGQWKSIDNAVLKHNKVTLEKYKSIIPYADKDEIINSILFLQEMTLQMQTI